MHLPITLTVTVSLVVEPSEFSATHTYWPLSESVAEKMVRDGLTTLPPEYLLGADDGSIVPSPDLDQ